MNIASPIKEIIIETPLGKIRPARIFAGKLLAGGDFSGGGKGRSYNGTPAPTAAATAATDAGGVSLSAPQGVTGRAVNSTALAISWLQTPATTTLQHWLTGYWVVISPARLDTNIAGVLSSSSDLIETVVPASGGDPSVRRTVTVVIGELDKFTPYTVAVAALSARGVGPFSDAIVVQTQEDGIYALT